MKCCRPTCIVKLMRNHGIDIVLYLDDGFGFGQDFYTCLQNLNFVRDTLIKAVCIINFEKSILQPVQCLEWLSLMWNSMYFSLGIPGRWIEETIHSIEYLINKFPLFLRQKKMVRVSGNIISMYPVVGNVFSLMTLFSHREQNMLGPLVNFFHRSSSVRINILVRESENNFVNIRFLIF